MDVENISWRSISQERLTTRSEWGQLWRNLLMRGLLDGPALYATKNKPSWKYTWPAFTALLLKKSGEGQVTSRSVSTVLRIQVWSAEPFLKRHTKSQLPSLARKIIQLSSLLLEILLNYILTVVTAKQNTIPIPKGTNVEHATRKYAWIAAKSILSTRESSKQTE